MPEQAIILAVVVGVGALLLGAVVGRLVRPKGPTTENSAPDIARYEERERALNAQVGKPTMRIEIPKEWSLKMAHLEGDAEIGAGAHAIDPIFDGGSMHAETAHDDASIAFGRFIRLMRRDRGLTVEKLAEDIRGCRAFLCLRDREKWLPGTH